MTDLTTVDTSRARLPSTYQAARTAISQCASLDECKEWSDKAAALASYAKQAQDDQLEKMAKRIRARAERRYGELSKQLDGRAGQNLPNLKEGADPPLSKKAAAEATGMSIDRMRRAERLADIPDDGFEEMVEADVPITTMARRTPNRDEARRLLAAIQSHADRLSEIDLAEACAALDDVQRSKVRMLIGRLDGYHDKVVTSI